ncbi:hypothetical protein [Saccharomonospora cyanea]|uniref:Uncharacterized protein n=1 Tax=Saccharomonospora cyanea NA-134 TaxID=882082 RepID=H5XL50_9PSEU|nr:hypothetical protein [Saccharomonospora cyanea]EHR63558.1 hypothetical protein SaccyDRAFT_4752 [Saccharomonospora cyanea NA-134]
MVDESLPRDGFAVPLRLHNVLLALAGRLDDSALSDARELVARSHLDDAAELAVGALIAGRIMVRPSEQRELALVLEMSRSDAALADQLTVGESVSDHAHRFSRDNDPDAGISEALDRTLQVLPDVRTVHAVWRNTPAGSVPGPLPQRVVLIEIGPEAHPPAVAFRVDDALRRSGIRAVVEVTGPSAERTDYHEAALASATPVWLASGQASGDAGGSGSRSRSPRKITAGAARARAEATRRPSHAVVEPSVPMVEPSVPAQPEQHHTPPEPPAEEVPQAREESPQPVGVPEPQAADEVRPEPVDARPEPADVRPEPVEELPTPREEAEKPSFSAEELAELENRVAETTEMSPEEVAQLRAAIAEDSEKGREIAGLSASMVELPELDLDDPQLSERDRQLLRELHAELAERERAEAARANGAERSWGDSRPS